MHCGEDIELWSSAGSHLYFLVTQPKRRKTKTLAGLGDFTLERTK